MGVHKREFSIPNADAPSNAIRSDAPIRH
jgi:hypothetical protein